MKYIGDDRTYTDAISGIGIKLVHDMDYSAALIRDEHKASITIGANAEIVIDYGLDEVSEEWEVSL